MKRYLLTVLFSLATLVSVRADLIWYEGFNYADGPIVATSTNSLGTTTNWFKHSGTANPGDSIVRAKRLEISTSGTGLARQDDVNRPLCVSACTYTNSGTILYASFTANFTNLPSAGGAYFAHFQINGTTFPCRIWAWTTGTALPNTYRLGISAGTQTTPNKVIPVDLFTNVDYQVVVKWDTGLGSATLWINPLSEGEIGTGLTSDTAGVNVNPPIAFGIRQATGFGGFLTLSNLAVATTFDEAATNVWSRTPVAPILLKDLQNATNFVGAPASLSVIPNGQSLIDLSYQWIKDNVPISNPGGNSNVFAFPVLAAADAGQYQVVVSNLTSGLSVTSSVAFVGIDPRTIPPFFVVSPKSATNYFGGTVTLTAAAAGPQPLTYNWLYNGAPITSPNVSGVDSGTLTIIGIHTNNGTAGNYTCIASNEFGLSTNANAFAQAIAPVQVSIAYLRTLVDGVNFLATNSTSLWEATGTVTTLTNITTGNTASYYLQDGTAGINIFATFGSTFRPAQGDVVKFVGLLSSFNSTLELLADTTGNPATSYSVIGSAATLPAPKVIPFSITNNLALCESLEGRIVMLTNVYFGTNAGTTINADTSANATSIVVTNASGQKFNVGFAAVDLDVAGKTLPSFAYAVIGPLTQNLNNTATPRNAGYQVTVTRFSDIVTDAPPAVVLGETHSGEKSTLTWTNVAWDNAANSYGSNYAYSVLASTNVVGPYAPVTRYEAVMLGINENPANVSRALGFGTVGLSADQTKITVNMSFQGLIGGNASAAHIHGPGGINSSGVGTNASVLFPFASVPAATSGSIPEQTFTITPTQLGYLTNGYLYMNVHNTTFGGGEIRGQIFLIPATGLTSPNSSFLNTTPTTASYMDPSAGGNQKFYRVTSP